MKKFLAVSAIAALGFSSLASAGGFPEEVMPMAPMAYGSDAGIYIGIEGGWGLTNWKAIDGAMVPFEGGSVKGGISKDNGAVGRVFLGYDTCKYFAIEAGYTYFFNKPAYKPEGGTEVTAIKRTHVVDLMGKIKAPVTDEFNIYAKLGANYLMTEFDEDSGLVKGSVRRFNVAFGAGVDYFITPNVIANIEWLRFNGNKEFKFGEEPSYQPYTDAFMIGLRYKFDM